MKSEKRRHSEEYADCKRYGDLFRGVFNAENSGELVTERQSAGTPLLS